MRFTYINMRRMAHEKIFVLSIIDFYENKIKKCEWGFEGEIIRVLLLRDLSKATQ